MNRTCEELREEWISSGRDPEGFDALVKAKDIVLSKQQLKYAESIVEEFIKNQNDSFFIRVFF